MMVTTWGTLWGWAAGCLGGLAELLGAWLAGLAWHAFLAGWAGWPAGHIQNVSRWLVLVLQRRLALGLLNKRGLGWSCNGRKCGEPLESPTQRCIANLALGRKTPVLSRS